MSYRLITIDERKFKYTVGPNSVWIQDIGSVFIGLVGRCVDVSMDRYEVTPAMIETFIRARLNMPRAEKIPAPQKKVDPGPRTRGFAKIIGSEVERVEVNDQNKIVLHCTDGSSYLIDAYMADRGEPILTYCTQTCLPDPSYD